MNNIWDDLRNLLTDMGYAADLVALDQEETRYQLVVGLGETASLRMTIVFLGDLLALASGHPGMKDASDHLQESKTDFLQLFVRYPFEVQKTSIPDLARLLLMINWSTPIGAFGLNEPQEFVFYRHVFECIGDEPSLNMIAETISGMNYYADYRQNSLATIASAEMSLEQYINDRKAQDLLKEEFPGYDL